MRPLALLLLALSAHPAQALTGQVHSTASYLGTSLERTITFELERGENTTLLRTTSFYFPTIDLTFSLSKFLRTDGESIVWSSFSADWASDPSPWSCVLGTQSATRTCLWTDHPDGSGLAIFAERQSTYSLRHEFTWPAPIPEPGTILLVATGLVGLALSGHRKAPPRTDPPNSLDRGITSISLR